MAGAGGGCKMNDGWVSALCSPLPLETTTSSCKPLELDKFLSGQHDHNYPFGLALSIPASSKDDHENDEDEGSVTSEMTMMTYRAEAMKEAIGVEYRKFKQQMEEQGYVEAHPNDNIKAIFARSMSSPNVQQSITSYASNASLKMKEVDARRFGLQPSGTMDREIKTPRTHSLHHLGQYHRANRATTGSSANSIMQKRVDDLYVEFGARPARSAEKNVQTTTRTMMCEVTDLYANEQVATGRAGDNLEEKTMTPEQHLDSIIQLKLKLAEKQTILDELSSKYTALQASVQKQRLESQFQANMEQNKFAVLTENSQLRQENEFLRLKLRELQLGSSSTSPRDDYQHGLPDPHQQTTHGQQRPFNIHQVLQDRLTDGKKPRQNPPSPTSPSEFKLFQASTSTHSTATDRRRSSTVTDGSTATNDSVFLQHPAYKSSTGLEKKQPTNSTTIV